MTIIIPYTFVAGTKAKANEVNANLRTLVTEINSQENQLVQVQSDIENLETTKASLNGNSSQRFSVANPVNSFDSVNKQTLSKSISNSVNFIDGYGIHKATNTTFIVDAGTCYDSTSSVILNKTVSSSKEISPISASTTYNVFVVGDDTGSYVDIIYSTTSVDPPLPSGYTKYRLIGTVTTNSNNQISLVSSIGKVNGSDVYKYVVADFTNPKQYYANTSTTIPSAGWVVCRMGSGEGVRAYLNKNNICVMENDQSQGGGRAGALFTTQWVIVDSGDVIYSNSNFVFYPMKGSD